MAAVTALYVSSLAGREEIAEGTMAFHLTRPPEFQFRAGQYVDLTLLDPPETDAEGDTRAFSLVNAPSAADLVVATRMRDTAFKRVLKTARLGVQVQIEGPMGSFTLHKNATRPAVLIAGGIGITPFMSMLGDVRERQVQHEIYLFYSNGWPEYAPYLRELVRQQDLNPRFHLVATMTEIERSRQSWQGEIGPIDRAMLGRHLPDTYDPLYYIAGSTGMVADMERMLIEAGVDEDNIRTEQFGGY